MTITNHFLRGYLEYALWTSIDDNGTPLEKNYSPDDLSPEALAAAIEDCRAFEEECQELWQEDGGGPQTAGGDFWLTRNGHGAGFWDGDYPKNGDELTRAAHAYGGADLYVGDDGKLYFS